MAEQNNNKIKLSPKLAEFCKWEKISYVNELLDSGESPNAVCKWANKQGFKISTPLVYEYAKIRSQALLNGISMEKILGITQSANTVTVKQGVHYNTKKERLRNEIDALDKIIDMGYTSLQKYSEDKPMPVSIMMQAIKLKNELTDNYFGGLTPWGLEQLTLMEKQKYDLVMEVLMEFVPEESRQQATDAIATAEEDFYKNSDYYEDWLRANGLSEDEIDKKMREYEREQREKELESGADGVIEV